MARIRTIKPEFFTSESVCAVSPLARLLFIGMWLEADREGRLAWKINTLKIRYLPIDDVNIKELADELIDEEMIVIYEVNKKKYCEIPGFIEHQVINNREKESSLPPRVKVASRRVKAEGKEGREGKGKEGKDIKAKWFEDFWNAFAYKQGRDDAFKTWMKIKNLDQTLADQIIQAAKNYADYRERVLKPRNQTPKMAQGWLSKKRWSDELPKYTNGHDESVDKVEALLFGEKSGQAKII